MTSDIDSLIFLIWGFHETWVSIIMLSSIMVLVYTKVGEAILVGVYVMIGAFVFNFFIGSLMMILFMNI